MRIVAILVLLVGIGLAGGALMFASKYFAAYEASLAANNKVPELKRVIVARKQIKYGDELNNDNLKWVDWPAESVPEGFFTTAEAMFGDELDRKPMALRVIEENEPILKVKITGFGQQPRMAMLLANGKRAVTISINAISGVGGFIGAGDHVDILMTQNHESGLVTSVILQDIPVIAIDQSQRSEGVSARVGNTATVEVDSIEAQKLALAQQVGRLSLLLRGIDDIGKEIEAISVTAEDLVDLGGEKVQEKMKIRVRKGTTVTTEAFDEEAEERAADEAAPNPEKVTQ